MAISLGKRKRQLDSTVANSASTGSNLPPRSQKNISEDDEDALAKALFQRAFEAKFRPLEKSTSREKVEVASSNVDDLQEQNDIENANSDWSGLSTATDDEVEVVQFSQATGEASAEELRNGKKSFMSSKPPLSSSKRHFSSAKAVVKTDEPDLDGSEAMNLKHDLALQRLLKESHLLDPSAFHTSSLEPQGNSRLKALDMRLKDLGAKKSILQQQKMPMSHRKGIIAKAAGRETTRRREAAENGVVLEKARKNNAKPPTQRRERGIGGPTVGKFKGGTLSLSSRDIKSIEDQRFGGGGGRRRKK